MKIWQRYAIKTLALANFLNFLIGAYWLRFAVSHFQMPAAMFEYAPYSVQVFYAMSSINALCLLALVIGSVYLWRLRPLGMRICYALFVFELLYWLAKKPILFLLWKSYSDTALLIRGSISFSSALGNAGLSVQQQFLYPLLGLVVLLAAGAKWKHPSPTAVMPRSQSPAN